MLVNETGSAPERRKDGARAQELRARLIAHLERCGDLTMPRVKEAMLRTPRHLFVPEDEPLEEAYANRPLPIGFAQTISQPAVVAWMTEALELSGENGCSRLGRARGTRRPSSRCSPARCTRSRSSPSFARQAQARLAELGCRNVHVRAADGAAGWPEHAPYDRIIATAAAAAIPPAWLEQLVDGGLLVAPVGAWDQRLVRVRRRGGRATVENLGWVAFVPLLPA